MAVRTNVVNHTLSQDEHTLIHVGFVSAPASLTQKVSQQSGTRQSDKHARIQRALISIDNRSRRNFMRTFGRRMQAKPRMEHHMKYHMKS